MKQEITVFTIGDANEIKTWSNVPYFFTKSLEKKGIKINTINIEVNRTISSIFRYSINIFLKLVYKKTDYTYFRSRLNHYLTSKKINSAIKKYPQSDVFLFLTYSFSLEKSTNKKIVLFGDWTYLYKLTKLDKRLPYWFEKYAINKERENINNADVIISLFPKSQEFILDHFKNKKTYYLGNVINSSYIAKKDDLIKEKLLSNSIVFIGNKKYKQGAIDLIKACNIYNQKNNFSIKLNIIGLNKNELDIIDTNVVFHGYLDKGIKNEYELYYKLISEAKIIVNTTPIWGGFSAMTEAMFYYTPVITTPYEEFVETYGENIDFGYYITTNTTEELISKIENVFKISKDDYIKLMEQSHSNVKHFSWDSYIDNFLEKII